ncbi:Fe(3+)-transporting ATPase [Thermodesulfobium narugense DSM 14796]|uniref:Fe(3+)-transporting ATPase n=1 Tax=Thermodesulfobium narugense DSM 14796 TaxID=747365 RepID=M1E9F0_9BACT|nr:ABC transporter ATP-binding protein [Thermodesulfobium narugense]AEE15164.1 Fe(3+)-transporting ATPase [Thermodesulfobium narugense DSM 14796]
MISIVNITKSFGKKKVLDNINLELDKGKILTILGPDGSGKTTLIKIIIGLLRPDSGEIFINNINITKNISSTRELIGYKAQEFSLYQDLTISENIRFFGNLYSLSGKELDEREDFILEFIGLKSFKHRFAEALSGGMKTRLAIGCALIHNPPVLLLDEPNVGVDPASRKSVWKLLRELTNSGKTIIVTTPYFLEGELSDKVVFIKEGKTVLSGKPKELLENIDFIVYKIEGENLQNFYFDLKKKEFEFKYWLKNEHIRILLSKNEEFSKISEKILVNNNKTVKIDKPDLEDIYLWHST